MSRSRVRPSARDAAAPEYPRHEPGRARVHARVRRGAADGFGSGPTGRSPSWDCIAERADDAPGDLVPGLLGETIHGAGGTTAYVGVRGRSHQEAAIAADRSGRVDTVALGTRRNARRANRARAGGRTRSSWPRLPPGPADPLPPRERNLLVIVAARASGGRGRAAAHGRRVRRRDAARTAHLEHDAARRDGRRSPTTRRRCCAGSGLDIPDDMQGRPIAVRPADRRTTSSRWPTGSPHIKDRRGAALRATFGAVARRAAGCSRWRDARGLGCGSACSWRCGCRGWRCSPARSTRRGAPRSPSWPSARSRWRPSPTGFVPWPRAPALAGGRRLGRARGGPGRRVAADRPVARRAEPGLRRALLRDRQRARGDPERDGAARGGRAPRRAARARSCLWGSRSSAPSRRCSSAPAGWARTSAA